MFDFKKEQELVHSKLQEMTIEDDFELCLKRLKNDTELRTIVMAIMTVNDMDIHIGVRAMVISKLILDYHSKEI